MGSALSDMEPTNYCSEHTEEELTADTVRIHDPPYFTQSLFSLEKCALRAGDNMTAGSSLSRLH